MHTCAAISALYLSYIVPCSPPEATVCPGSSDPPEKIFNIFASENEVYTIY